MHHTIGLSTIARSFGIAALIVALAATGVACSDDAADPAAYFEGLERSQKILDTTVEELFETSAAQELDRFADDPPAELTSEQEAVVRRFVTEFWTGATDAILVHRDEIEALGVPDVAKDAHRHYVEALDGFISTRDNAIAEAQSTDGAELLANFWEPDPQVEAVTDSCLAMAGLAVSEGFTISLPLCAEE